MGIAEAVEWWAALSSVILEEVSGEGAKDMPDGVPMFSPLMKSSKFMRSDPWDWVCSEDLRNCAMPLVDF